MLAPYISILFVLIAIALFIISAQRRHQAGLPLGKVIYTDTKRWGKVEKPLFDADIRLTGKPDYLVEQESQVIPVEVKSGRSPATPYDSHMYQLAAYCLLAWHEYGVRPDHGIIHYPNRTFAIDFTDKLEETVREIINEMQQRTTHLQTDRSHDEPERCIRCGYRSKCDQVLRI